MNTFQFLKHNVFVTLFLILFLIIDAFFITFLGIISIENIRSIFTDKNVHLIAAILLFVIVLISFNKIRKNFAKKITITFHSDHILLQIGSEVHNIMYANLSKFKHSSIKDANSIVIESKKQDSITLSFKDHEKFIQGNANILKIIARHVQHKIVVKEQKSIFLTEKNIQSIIQLKTNKQYTPISIQEQKENDSWLFIVPNFCFILLSLGYGCIHLNDDILTASVSLGMSILLLFSTIKLNKKFDWLSTIISFGCSLTIFYVLFPDFLEYETIDDLMIYFICIIFVQVFALFRQYNIQKTTTS